MSESMMSASISKLRDEVFRKKIEASEFPKVVVRKIIWPSENKQFTNKRKFPDDEVEEDKSLGKDLECKLSNALSDKDISCENLSIEESGNIKSNGIQEDQNSSVSVEFNKTHKDFLFTYKNCDFESEYRAFKGSFKLIHECTSFKCLMCGLIFNRKTDTEKHTDVHLSDSSTSGQLLFKEESLGSLCLFRSQKIRCLICGFECNDKNALEKHMTKHSNYIQQSSKGNLISLNETTNVNVKSRDKKVLVQKKLRNSDCDFEVNNRDDLADHLTLHESKYIQCSRCDFETNSSKLLERHLVIHKTDRNKCPNCDFESEVKEILKEHLLTHEGVYIQCPDCSFICSCKSAFNIHLLSHESKLFQCSKCDLICNRRFDFENHMSKHSKIYRCSKYAFISSNKGEGDRHSKEHETKNFKCSKTKNFKCSKTKNFKCSKCQFEGSNKEELEDHLLLHYQGQMFECSNCSYVTSIESQFEDHMKIHLYECENCKFKTIIPKNKKVKHKCLKKCTVCDFKTYNKDKWFNHRFKDFKHKEIFKYQCFQCLYATNKKSLLEKHNSTYHNMFSCTQCNFECKTISQYRHHKLKHRDNRFKCDKCDFKTDLPSQLKKHNYVKHSTLKAYKCLECDYECRNHESYRVHMSRHTRIYKFNCAHCDYKTAGRTPFEKHIQTHSKTKEFICSQCNFSTKTAQSLKSHMRIHSGKQRFKCDKCDYATNYKHNLKTHVLKHTNVRLFNCDQCEYTSNYKFCIERHVQITHEKDSKDKNASNGNEDSEPGEKESSKSKQTYKCIQCDYTTSYIGNLRVHKITSHSKKKDYSCSHCKYSTTSKDSFNLHSVDHLEMLKCFYCDFAPDSKPDLQEHILQHQKTSPKKKYQCDECGHVSTSRVGFNQHKKIHFKTKELKCPNCKYETNFRGNLIKHLKLKHSDERDEKG